MAKEIKPCVLFDSNDGKNDALVQAGVNDFRPKRGGTDQEPSAEHPAVNGNV